MAWGLIRAQEQFALVFTYVDPRRGPSAKGALVHATEPGPDDARAALERPNVTVRIEEGLRVRPLSPEQHALLKLPDEPPWLVHFKGERLRTRALSPKEPTPGRGPLLLSAVVMALAFALLAWLSLGD
jgi:hypothetical protein